VERWNVPLLADSFPAWAVLLLVIGGLLLIVVLLFATVPSLRSLFEAKGKSPEEVAKEDVKQIVVTPKESPAEKESRIDGYRKKIEAIEKEYGFYFTDIEYDSLLVQFEQDEDDDRKRQG